MDARLNDIGLLPATATLVALFGASGCCFGGGTTVTLDEDVSLTTSEPGYDVLSICAEEALHTPPGITTPRCTAHAPALPTAASIVQATFHTHDLARFARDGAVVVGLGEGAAFTEISRERVRAAPQDAQDGQRVSWSVRVSVYAPLTGWPAGAPVRFRLLDGNGAMVSEATTTFHGIPVPPPARRVLDELRVCRAEGLAGPESDRFCGAHSVALPGGSGELWITYPTQDPAAIREGFTLFLERRDGEQWREILRDPTPGLAEPDPALTYTLGYHYDLAAGAWRRGTTWRARLTTTQGRLLGEREFVVN